MPRATAGVLAAKDVASKAQANAALRARGSCTLMPLSVRDLPTCVHGRLPAWSLPLVATGSRW